MSTPWKTRVVLLTPAGRGAVASLLVEGPLAVAAVNRRFQPAGGRPLVEHPYGRIVVGRWGSREDGEEVVVCRSALQRVEVHCHGGYAAAAAITRSLVEDGCREVNWRQWIGASESEPISVAARIALASAPTERIAAILWDQYAGALAGELSALAAEIASGNSRVAGCRVDGLLEWAALGRHLIEPWRVVFAGRPNAGKSSLINALLGYQRSIVHDAPGTTRDVVTATGAIDGWPVELADTAGLHEGSEPLEAAGIRLAEEWLATADLVVWVFDASQGRNEQDESFAGHWPRVLRVYNKCDLLAEHTVRTLAGFCGVNTSATQRVGIDLLEREIARRLVPQAPLAGQAVPFAPEQIDLLVRLRAALSAGEVLTANRLLAQAKTRSLCDC